MKPVQVTNRKAKGLFTWPNQLALPEGALSQAQNCVVRKDHTIGMRRGYDRLGSQTAGAIDSMFEFQDTIVFLEGTTLRYITDIDTGATSAWSGSFSSHDANKRIRSQEVRKSLFFTTSEGVYKNDALTNSPTKAGLDPVHIEPHLATETAGGVVVAEDAYVAYRATLTITDANNYKPEGPVSNYGIFGPGTESTGSDLTFNIYLPDSATTSHKVRLYRTLSATSAAALGDDHNLVKEYSIASADITNGYITVTDDVDEAELQRNELLYTNDTVEGLASSNLRPPWCQDIALYKGYTWYFNYKRPHTVSFTLQDMSQFTPGVSLTLTSNGQSVQFYCMGGWGQDWGNNWGGPNPAPSGVVVEWNYVSQYDTTQEDVRATMLAFCKAVNTMDYATLLGLSSRPYYAEYISTPDSEAGTIRITRTDYDDTPIYVTASSAALGATFSPSLTTTTGDANAIVSEQESNPHGFIRSKLEEPEACPDIGLDLIDSEQSPILRALALQDAIIVCKDEGVYRISGETESDFSINPVDKTVKLVAPDTLVSLYNRAYGLTNQGVVAINQNGSLLVSRAVEDTINNGLIQTTIASAAFAVAYEAEREYHLFLPTSSSSDAREDYVYNYITEGWYGPWDKRVSCGHVLHDQDILFLGHSRDMYVLKERKARTISDFRDETLTASVTAVGTTTDSDGNTVSTATVTYTDNYTLTVGYLFRNGSDESIITAITDNGGNSYTLTLEDNLSLPTPGTGDPGGLVGLMGVLFTVASSGVGVVSTYDVEIDVAIDAQVRWAPVVVKDASILKQFTACTIHWRRNDMLKPTIGFETNYQSSESFVTGFSFDRDGVSGGNWGGDALGNTDRISTPMRTFIPRTFSLGTWLAVFFRNNRAKETFEIDSMSVTARQISERVFQ